MTEKQGGSDLRANTTVAEPIGDGFYELTGHKWFCTHPVFDMFFTLAQAPGGIACFVAERPHPGFRIQRLKDKLGGRCLASAEVEFDHLPARILGEEGRGTATIVEQIVWTRLDALIGGAGMMRRLLGEAVWHTRHRSAFGAALADQPAMTNVLADLAMESEAAMLLALRLARAFDEGDRAFSRLALSVSKYWVSKRGAPFAAEALECLGGNGYVETQESPVAQFYRDIQIDTVWEGSGNVVALDVLRAMAKAPEATDAFLAECELARGADPLLDATSTAAAPRSPTSPPRSPSGSARALVEDLALALQGSLMVRHSDPQAASAFCATRLGRTAAQVVRHAACRRCRGGDRRASADRLGVAHGDDRQRGDALLAAHEADSLPGGGLDVDRRAEGLGQRRGHRLAVGGDLRALEHDGRVCVRGRVARLGGAAHGLAQQLQRIGAGERLVGVREVRPEIPQTGGAEQGVDQRVGQDVGVRVPGEAAVVLDADAAEDECPSRLEAVGVPADTAAGHPSGSIRRLRFSKTAISETPWSPSSATASS